MIWHQLLFMQVLNLYFKRLDGKFFFLKNQPQRKVGEHIPCGYLMSMIWILNGIENKNDVYKKNTEKYKTFSVPVTKEVKRVGKTGE